MLMLGTNGHNHKTSGTSDFGDVFDKYQASHVPTPTKKCITLTFFPITTHSTENLLLT